MIDREDGTHKAMNAGSAKPKLAIVSTFDELCGIAAYTRFLIRQLESVFDVTVFDLDQYLLLNKHGHVRKLGDQHIREIADQLKHFDWVNIQLEHGTLGRDIKDIYRRFKLLVLAAPRISITFHTVLEPQSFQFRSFAKELAKLKLQYAFDRVVEHARNKVLANGIYKFLRKVQSTKPLSIIVHNRRDMRLMKYVNQFEHVYDHPLSFLSQSDVRAIRARTQKSDFVLLANVPEDAKLIGVFGFFGSYKGFDTAIRAMHYLPQDYHLLIFGGVHPNEIKLRQSLDPYIELLLEEACIDVAVLKETMGKQSSVAAQTPGASHARELRERRLKDLTGRIHFMGSLPDEQFTSGMAICDTVVLPYQEVGQSSSGPMSMAVEMGCRIVATRTHAFLQFARYYPGVIEFFDIGNYVDLAERLKSPSTSSSSGAEMSHGSESNIQMYVEAHSMVPRGADTVAVSHALPATNKG